MTLALILFSVFTLLVLAAALVDIIPAARTWVGRIGIGTLSGDTAREKIAAVCKCWLHKTPATPVSDQTRFTLPERLRGTYASRKLKAWQQASLLLGTAQTGDTAAVKAFRKSVLMPDGSWRKPPQGTDTAMLAYALLRTAEDSAAVRSAMDVTYAFLLDTVSGGTIPYNTVVPTFRFVDAVGMVCPFLYLYGKTYDCPQAIDLCMAQLKEYAEKGLHPTLHLPAHAVRQYDGAPLGIYGWGRGCGWYAFALAELTRCGADVRAFAAPFAEAVLSVQQPNGAFSRQVLADPGTESSATAMLGHFLAVESDASGNADLHHAALRALHAVYGVTRRNGVVDCAQGDTKGIGFYSTRLSPMPAAQGFALLLAEELR